MLGMDVKLVLFEMFVDIEHCNNVRLTLRNTWNRIHRDVITESPYIFGTAYVGVLESVANGALGFDCSPALDVDLV